MPRASAISPRAFHRQGASRLSISPLEGEMPGRAEGGDAPRQALDFVHTMLQSRGNRSSREHPNAKVRPRHREHARQMRKAMTGAELKFWNAVRAHRLAGLSFRRQLPVAGYIVDFACPSHKIIVELDGFQHAEDAAADYDRQRTETLEQCGWRVLRFWNEDVVKDIDNVCLHMIRTVKESQP